MLVWNRVAKSRDPDTGRRRMTLRPEAEWHRAEAPHLQIVSEALWKAVQARRARRARKGGPGGWGRAFARPRRPLSGLLRCGCCGGGVSIHKTHGASVWGRCSTQLQSGSCDNARSVRIDRVEAAILDGLAEELRNPIYLRAYLDAY